MAKVAVVFGGTRGIGKSVASKCIRSDFNTIVLSRNKDNVEEALHELRLLSGSNKHLIEGLQCDVNDETAIRTCCSHIEEKLGPTNILINAADFEEKDTEDAQSTNQITNFLYRDHIGKLVIQYCLLLFFYTGINMNQLLLQSSINDMKMVLETNLLGSMSLAKIFLKPMMRRRAGSIVNIGIAGVTVPMRFATLFIAQSYLISQSFPSGAGNLLQDYQHQRDYQTWRLSIGHISNNKICTRSLKSCSSKDTSRQMRYDCPEEDGKTHWHSHISNSYKEEIKHSSIIGMRGNVGQTVYSASKSGLIGFTKSLAREVASRNITVNLVMPGFIQTEMTASLDMDKIKPFIPLRRAGTPDEVAEAVYFLATSPFITGEVLVVDGGLQLAF